METLRKFTLRQGTKESGRKETRKIGFSQFKRKKQEKRGAREHVEKERM
jgi:hypothetical protein